MIDRSNETQLVQQHLANERTYLAWIRTSITIIGMVFLSANLVLGMTKNEVLAHTIAVIAQLNNELFSGYKLIKVDGCDLSGHREPYIVVDVGYWEREYWAFTNEYGQLVRVIADEIILQDDSNESVSTSGRYCSDEAKVPGVESDVLDEGHIIADSLGGVSNAYIFPNSGFCVVKIKQI